MVEEVSSGKQGHPEEILPGKKQELWGRQLTPSSSERHYHFLTD